MKQIAISVLLVTIGLLSYGQTGQPVTLQWKLQPKEVLSYTTIMQEIDTANFKDLSLNFGKMNDLLSDTAASSQKKFFAELNKTIANNNIVTRLTESRKGIIDIEMRLQEKKKEGNADTTGKAMLEMLRAMTGEVSLRGAVYATGGVQSFYVKSSQKNLVSLFFELPATPVKVGDTWSLAVNFIAMDQNFKCDTSYRKNMVTLVDLKKTAAGTIAVIKYDIDEYVNGDFDSPYADKKNKTMMHMTYNAMAEFSVEQGRWISYDGIMSLHSSGAMTSSTTKKFALIRN